MCCHARCLSSKLLDCTTSVRHMSIGVKTPSSTAKFHALFRNTSHEHWYLFTPTDWQSHAFPTTKPSESGPVVWMNKSWMPSAQTKSMDKGSKLQCHPPLRTRVKPDKKASKPQGMTEPGDLRRVTDGIHQTDKSLVNPNLKTSFRQPLVHAQPISI